MKPTMGKAFLMIALLAVCVAIFICISSLQLKQQNENISRLSQMAQDLRNRIGVIEQHMKVLSNKD